jgi:hypothetical protein
MATFHSHPTKNQPPASSPQNYSQPSSFLVIKTFLTKEIISIIKPLKAKNSHRYDKKNEK